MAVMQLIQSPPTNSVETLLGALQGGRSLPVQGDLDLPAGLSAPLEPLIVQEAAFG